MENSNREPLAERVRPKNLNSFIGQKQLLDKGKPLRLIIESGYLPSIILWGPPGCGKTSLARILAQMFNYSFHSFSAVVSGIRELKELFLRLERETLHKNIVFIDEIHRFNKAQQDAFLPYVERGVITLIGTTTLNPSFSIVSPLLSRMKVLVLKALEDEEIIELLETAIGDRENGYGKLKVKYSREILSVIASYAEGDGRAALNVLEMLVESELSELSETVNSEKREITLELGRLKELFQGKIPDYDRDGEAHYNLISALHKSIRGSDPDAALYWLARMLEGGEDPLYIARRLIRVAMEDVGLADPNALSLAVNAKDAVHFMGMPEGDLALAETVIYLATAPKSNTVYTAYNKAKKDAAEYASAPVPLYLKNPVTSVMRKAGYGKGYMYPHDYPNRVVSQDYFPEKMGNRRYYNPTEYGYEKTLARRIEWWREKKRDK